jgi:hypothetical protein
MMCTARDALTITILLMCSTHAVSVLQSGQRLEDQHFQGALTQQNKGTQASQRSSFVCLHCMRRCTHCSAWRTNNCGCADTQNKGTQASHDLLFHMFPLPAQVHALQRMEEENVRVR